MAKIVYNENVILAAEKALNEITVTGVKSAENLVLISKILDTGKKEPDEMQGQTNREEEKEHGN